MKRRVSARAACAGLAFAVVAGMSPAAATRLMAGRAAQATQAPVELLLDQGRRLFDAFQYDQAVALFDRLLAAMAAADPAAAPKPELVAQAYELRARARFALGDTTGAEQDFAALLRAVPGFRLAPSVSPRVVALLEGVRKLTVGQVAASLVPPGEVQIDGRPYPLQSEPQPIDLPAGEHLLTAARPGYATLSRRFSVTAGETLALPIELERVSATLSITSIPDEVEVVLDGTRRGVTRRGEAGSSASAPLVLSDLSPGAHRLQLRRSCYVSLDRTLTIERPADLQVGPLELAPATATVQIDAAPAGAAVLVDGTVRGQTPLVLRDLCEGAHVIEVRAAGGRFVDRREWKAGDNATLRAALRSAFPIVAVATAPGRNADALRAEVERAFAASRNLLVYAPGQAELSSIQGETLPPGWLLGEVAGLPARVPREATRELGRSLAARLDAQGVAVVSAGADPSLARVALLASGSGEPDVVQLDLTDAASRAQLVERLATPLPPLRAPSIETAVVDLAGVRGAVVVQAEGAGARAGLSAGDVIVGAGDVAVASVAELRARIAEVRPPATRIGLDVRTVTGASRKANVPVTLAASAVPLHGILPSNLALLDLQRRLADPSAAAERQAVLLNLGIVQMKLSNWAEAAAALAQVQAAEAGIAPGTVAYLRGLCLEATGRIVEAQAAFATAAASGGARLWTDGPLVAPLAQAKLRAR